MTQPPVPTREELAVARQAAKEARAQADALQVMASKSRSHADALSKHYHDMLDIAHGQYELGFDDTEQA